MILFVFIGYLWFFSEPTAPIHICKPIVLGTETVVIDPRIKRLNELNANIQSLTAEVAIHVKGIKLNAQIFHEKNINFRMLARSIAGLELDYGSNSKIFWFWSKRFKPPALYFADLTNVHKCNLRDSFSPILATEIFGIHTINEKCSVSSYANYLAASEVLDIKKDNKLSKVTLIDPDRNVIIGQYIYDQNQKLLISIEIKSFQKTNGFLLPKSMRLVWYEENVSANWEISGYQINPTIEKFRWEKPEIKQEIDMSKVPTNPIQSTP